MTVIGRMSAVRVNDANRRKQSFPRKRESMGGPMSRQYYVYILASKPNGTLYIGMTNNVARRVWQHRQGLVEGFTKRYTVHRLVHCETFARPIDAIQREKRLKKWNRAWKIQLIESANPEWKDLYETVMHMP
jgi:putative endonuclease